MKNCDPRLLFGFALALMMFILAETIALGNVREESSFCLKETMTVFAVMSGSFVQWAFSNMKNGKPPEP